MPRILFKWLKTCRLDSWSCTCLLYINDLLLDDIIWKIIIYADDSTLCSYCDQASDLWQQLELTYELKSDLQDTVDWGRRWLVDFNTGKTQLVSFNWSNNTSAVNVKIDEYVLEEKSYFKMLVLSFSSKLGLGSYIISSAKTQKIHTLMHSLKFLSPEVTLYLCKSTIWSCMEYCCLICADDHLWYWCDVWNY